jgi:lipoprotein-anchoring transpeptidase ErfK/SrfK
MQRAVRYIREIASVKGDSKTALIRTQKIKPKDTHPPKPSRKRVIKNHTRKYDDTRWVTALFISIVVIGLALFYWFGFPLLNVQAAKGIAAPRPEGALMKPTLTSTTTSLPTQPPTPIPTATPAPDQQTTFTPFVNISYASYFAHSWDIPEKVASNIDFWIEVDLSEQKVYAYEGSTLLNSFAVSTGTKAFPTVTGTYKIYAKYPYYTMRGPGYYLTNVPYSMFFYKGYSLHGTYWHHNFGTPMSHGCVNMETSAAAWLYDRIHLGTKVFIHI